MHLSLSIIKSAIAANNAEYRMRAVIALFMGIATSLLVYITLIGIFFITMVTGPWLLYASVLFGFFFLLGLFQARKSDYDPLSGIAPPSERVAAQPAQHQQARGGDPAAHHPQAQG